MPDPYLLLDVGNSRLKSGLWQDGKLKPLHSAEQRGENLEDELARLAGLLEAAPRAVATACVRGEATREQLSKWCHARFNKRLIVAEPQMQSCGLTNSYAVPGTMGVDRWTAMIGAWARCERAFCIADLGTATTIDAVGPDGKHLGGLISPGSTLMKQAITQRAPGVFVDASAQIVDWADNTQDAVFSGAAWSVFDLILGFHGRLEDFLADETPLFLCGGAAMQFLDMKPSLPQLQHCPDLVLEGLGIWLDRELLA